MRQDLIIKVDLKELIISEVDIYVIIVKRKEGNTCFREFYACFGFEPKTGSARIFTIFVDRLMFSHIIQKVSERTFH